MDVVFADDGRLVVSATSVVVDSERGRMFLHGEWFVCGAWFELEWGGSGM